MSAVGGILLSCPTCDLVPAKIKDTVNHNLRNKEDYRDIRARIDKYKDSVIVDGIRLWNECLMM